MNRRQLFLSTAKAALATAFTGLWFKKGAHAQAPTAVKFPNSTVLPTPTPPFEGVIEANLVESTPGWPPTIAPPAGAPNVLLILIDDAGYGSNSVFGGIVPTPALESLARRGLRYTQMHTAASAISFITLLTSRRRSSRRSASRSRRW
jgi:arylsulfatase